MILPQQLARSVASRVLAPEFVQRKYAAFSSNSFSFVIDATPIEGTLMVIATGGVQVRTPSFPAGFTPVDMGASGTNFVAYKFAGAGESTTITVTWNLSLDGSMQYYEFANIDTVTPVVAGTGAVGTAFVADTSVTYTTYNVLRPSVYVVNLDLNNTLAWGIDNSFIIQPTSSRFFSAYKIYTSPIDGEITTWTGASGNGAYTIIGFNGKQT